MSEQNQEKQSSPKVRKPNAYDEPFGNQKTASFAENEVPLSTAEPLPAPKASSPRETTRGTEELSTEPSVKKAPAKKPVAPKKTASGKDTKSGGKKASSATTVQIKNKKDKPAIDLDIPRSSRVLHKILPYCFWGVAIFIFAALFLHLFCLKAPETHAMHVAGQYICRGLFGMLGPAAFAIPLILLNLGIYWRRFIDQKVAIAKIIASVVFLISLAIVIHTFSLIGVEEAKRNLSAGELLYAGTMVTSGGVIGGKLSFLLYSFSGFVGALIIGFLLLGISLFYCLGMTPQHLWNMLRNRGKIRHRTPSYSEQSAEDAENHAKMEEKIRRTTKDQMHINDRSDYQDDLPLGAVRVVSTPSSKKSNADKMAPMPMPRLNPNDGDEIFVPDEVGERMAQMENAEAEPVMVASNTQKPMQSAPSSSSAVSVPAASYSSAASTAASTQVPAASAKPIDPASNRDAAVEPIFPKMNEGRSARRVPRADRNFDLKSIFIDLDDTDARSTRNLAPVPPEVPLNQGQARPKPAVASTPASSRPTATRPMPSSGASANPSASATPASAEKAPVRPSSVSSIRTPGAPSAAKTQGKPAFSQVAPQKQDFGLSNEEFERLEAQQPNLTKPLVKKAAPTAPSSAKSVTSATTKDPKVAPKPTPKRYTFPPISYLHQPEPMTEENRAELEASMNALATTLKSFRVGIEDNIRYACGPTVTRYEITPAAGVRVRNITNLSDDIALALRSSGGVRIEAPIPGTNSVGIEVPNKTRSTIYLRELIESKEFGEAKSKLTACLGAGIAGEPLIFDIAKMPHLLIAGTTGSGKSVCINCIVMSLLYRVTPDEVKLVMIDPKKVEFSIYKNIPHLMAPVVTTPKDAAGALQASVEEMERRFELFEQVGVRDLKGYNAATADDPDMPNLPHIVIIIDELADLMMTARDEVETAICRIAQKARAAGMHLIIGTQRPSADVVTGLIKSNVPSRIAFAVKSQVDSRVILDHIGAEALTGRGDMLFVPIGAMRDTRVQGAFVDDKEVEKICEFIRATNGTAEYDEKFIKKLKELAAQCGNKGRSQQDFTPSGDEGGDKSDPKYVDALRIAIEEKRVSTSLLQRKLEIGYSRAAKLIDRMQSEGYVSAPDGSKPRTILITPEEYMAKFVDGAEGDAN